MGPSVSGPFQCSQLIPYWSRPCTQYTGRIHLLSVPFGHFNMAPTSGPSSCASTRNALPTPFLEAASLSWRRLKYFTYSLKKCPSLAPCSSFRYLSFLENRWKKQIISRIQGSLGQERGHVSK